MQPLSLKTRRLYATISFILFVIILPVAALYASGYRLSGLGLTATGGVYVSTSASEVTILINGKEEGRSGLFQKNFFFDNLAPGAYVVQASRKGFYPWSKNLIVEPRLVTDVSVPSIPQPLLVREILVEAEGSVATSTVRTVSAGQYADIEAVFNATSTMRAASEPVDEASGAALFIENGNLSVRWMRGIEGAPSSFCLRPSVCAEGFHIEHGKEIVTRAQFFAGGAVYATEESGVFFAEVDIRDPRFVVPLYTRAGSDFRVINGDLIIADDNAFFEIADL